MASFNAESFEEAPKQAEWYRVLGWFVWWETSRGNVEVVEEQSGSKWVWFPDGPVTWQMMAQCVAGSQGHYPSNPPHPPPCDRLDPLVVRMIDSIALNVPGFVRRLVEEWGGSNGAEAS